MTQENSENKNKKKSLSKRAKISIVVAALIPVAAVAAIVPVSAAVNNSKIETLTAEIKTARSDRAAAEATTESAAVLTVLLTEETKTRAKQVSGFAATKSAFDKEATKRLLDAAKKAESEIEKIDLQEVDEAKTTDISAEVKEKKQELNNTNPESFNIKISEVKPVRESSVAKLEDVLKKEKAELEKVSATRDAAVKRYEEVAALSQLLTKQLISEKNVTAVAAAVNKDNGKASQASRDAVTKAAKTYAELPDSAKYGEVYAAVDAYTKAVVKVTAENIKAVEAEKKAAATGAPAATGYSGNGYYGGGSNSGYYGNTGGGGNYGGGNYGGTSGGGSGNGSGGSSHSGGNSGGSSGGSVPQLLDCPPLQPGHYWGTSTYSSSSYKTPCVVQIPYGAEGGDDW